MVLLAVGYLTGNVLAHLVGQLCQHLCFLSPEETATPQTVVQLFHVGRLLGTVAEPGNELLIASEVIKAAEDSQLLYEVGVVVDNWCARKSEYPLFAFAYTLNEFSLLCL